MSNANPQKSKKGAGASAHLTGFLQDIQANPHNRAILQRWPSLNLPDGWLVAGCLFQTVWNLRSGEPAEAQIKDYDLFYFDATDLSPQAERKVQAHVDAVLCDLGIAVEAKNQARVHTWYEEYFGHPYPRLRHSCEGIDRFLVLSTCVGVRPVMGAEEAPGLEVYAPHGLDSLYEGLLAPNPLVDHADLFRNKAASYMARWPWLRISAPRVA